MSLGALFWFDILNKVVNVRLAGKNPSLAEEPKKESTASGSA